MAADHELDEILSQIGLEMCYEEWAELEKAMIKEPIHIFSDQYGRKKEQVIKGRTFHKMQDISGVNMPKKRGRIQWKYLLVAVLLLILSVSTVLAFEPLRKMMKEIMYTVFTDHVSIEGIENQQESVIKGGLRKPTYVPAGYELTSQVIEEEFGECYLVWTNRENESLSYIQCNPDQVSVSITSNETNPKDIEIGQHKGKTIIDKKGVRSVFFEEDGWLYVLTGNVRLQEMVKVLEKLE